jgi:predicted nucleic acid-binding protein
MESIVVDTNVVSYALKSDSRAQLYAEDLKNRRLCVSFMTVAELRLWAVLKKWGPTKLESLEQALHHYVILPYDDETVWEWARLGAHERQNGRDRRDRADWWIAACALRHRIPLVTHNPRDFAGIASLTVVTRFVPQP